MQQGHSNRDRHLQLAEATGPFNLLTERSAVLKKLWCVLHDTIYRNSNDHQRRGSGCGSTVRVVTACSLLCQLPKLKLQAALALSSGNWQLQSVFIYSVSLMDGMDVYVNCHFMHTNSFVCESWQGFKLRTES